MNPVLEINPAACLFVMGPQLSHKVGRNSTSSNTVGAGTKQAPFRQALPATYSSILDSGLSLLNTKLTAEGPESSVELAQIKKVASEEGPTKAMERLVGLMKRKNCYNEWLKSTFGGAEKHGLFINSSVDKNSTEEQHTAMAAFANYQAAVTDPTVDIDSIQHLLSLQQQGALLACTQYDTILDSIAGTRPLTLHNTETLKRWSKLSTLPETISFQDGVQRNRKQQHHPVGILHLHGVCTDPSSVRFTDYERCREDEESENTVETSTPPRGRKPIPVSHEDCELVAPGMDLLREIFRKRLVIFVGYDRDYFDPLLPGLLQKLYPDNEPGSLKNPPILLTSMPLTRQLSIGKQLPSTFLTLMVSEEEIHNMSQVISSGSPKNFTVGKGLTDKQSSDGLKVQAFLLFNEKQSFRKLGDVIYQQSKSGEIYVRRDALTVIFDDNKILYGNLVTYGGNGLRQLWNLVFSEGSTLLGKGLMALGLQNAAIIWTNRKPAELGNVTGINSVHTYAAHKAVHTMALAQQQYSSSNSIVQSAPLSSTVPVENSTTTSHRTAVTSNLQKLSLQSNPMLQPVAAGQLASPSKGNESNNGGRGGRDSEREQRERGNTRRGEKEKRENVNSAAMVNSSSSDSGLIMQQAAAMSSLKSEKAHPVVTAASPLTTVPALIPHNYLLPGTAALTSSPMTSSAMALGGLNLSTLHTPLTVAAMSNQLLAGLPAAAITPTGISTPTGLVSPVLFGNNPFLSVLGSSPSLSTTVASQPVAGGVLQATPVPATLNQAAGTSINLQLITQLQEKINAHLQAMPSTQRGDIGNMLAAATGPGRTLQQALSISGLDQELSKRERLLESLLISKTPVYCIASAPEILVSDSLSSEHKIEYIDTLRKPSRSRDSSEIDGRCSEDEQVDVMVGSSSDLSQRETAKESRIGQSSRAGLSLMELMSSKKTEAKLSTSVSLIKDPAVSPSDKTHSLGSPSHTITHSPLSNTTTTIPIPSQVAASRTPSVLGGISLSSTTNKVTPSPLSTSSLTATTAQLQQALPLLSYAVPPTTTAALTSLASPLKSYYIMLNNPLAAAVAGAAVGGATAVQPLMITAAATPGPTSTTPTVHGGAAAAVQVPLTAAGLNLPLLATTTLSSVPSPMYYYMPATNPVTLATNIGGVVEERQKELESKLRSHGVSTSLQIARAKKRQRNDPVGLTEAKRIRMDAEGIQVDSEEEGGAMESATASESDDEGTEKISVHSGENYKSSGYKGHLQLWEFLLDLLLTPNHGSIIQWTGNEYEFNIVNPEAVVRLWGAHKNKPQMTYDKMSRSLRYYYSQGVMDKVPGKRYTFKFAFDIQKYIIDNKKTSLFTLTS